MKILHITNWFPNPDFKKEALWIKRQIDSMTFNCSNIIYHFEIFYGPIKIKKNKKENVNQLTIQLPVKQWFIIELIYFFWLSYMLLFAGIHKRADIINFHIAYPMLSYWHLIKRFIKKPVVITEHWSGYHFNFNTNRKLPRIKRIFNQGLPLIAVSQALVNDIKRFSGSDFPSSIVPNVVDKFVFLPSLNTNKEESFFMVSLWKNPKNPFPAMEAFLKFNKDLKNKYKLVVAGYGPLWNEMQKWVALNDVHSSIRLIGELNGTQIADLMRRCRAFLHPTMYETFSVVCAEAVSCGATVIAPNVGGIPEVLTANDILLEKWDTISWYKSLHQVLKNCNKSARIDEDRFSKERIGELYRSVLIKMVDEAKK